MYNVGDFVYFNCGFNGNNYGRIIKIYDSQYYRCELLYDKHGGTQVPQSFMITDKVTNGYEAMQNEIDLLKRKIDVFKDIMKKEKQNNKFDQTSKK